MKRKRRTKAEMEAARSATANVGFRDIFDVLDNSKAQSKAESPPPNIDIFLFLN